MKEIEEKVSKEVGDINIQASFQGKTPTRFMPYPSLELTISQMTKVVTPIRHVLVQTYLHAIYRYIRKEIVQNGNDDRLHAMPTHKILLTVADSFMYSVI